MSLHKAFACYLLFFYVIEHNYSEKKTLVNLNLSNFNLIFVNFLKLF